MKFRFISSVFFFRFPRSFFFCKQMSIVIRSKCMAQFQNVGLLLKTFTLHQSKSIDIAPQAKVNTIESIENDLHVKCMVGVAAVVVVVISGFLLFLPMRTV